jgi:hypothetical protein
MHVMFVQTHIVSSGVAGSHSGTNGVFMMVLERAALMAV